MSVIGAFKTFAAIGGGALGVVGGVLTTIGGILTSFPVIVAGVTVAFTGAFMGIAKKWDEITDLFSAGKWGEALSLMASSAITGVIATFGKLAAYLAEALGFEAEWITTFKDAFSEETFDEIMLGIGNTIMGGWDTITTSITEFWEDLDLFGPATDAAESAYQGFLDFFQISSPSALMTDMIGGPMIDGILAPFTDIGSKLKELMMDALAMVPEPIKNLMLGKSVFETAGELANMATDKVTGVFDAVSDAVGGDETKEPYVLNISLTMDGREIDKKVINVIGGVARDATR